jgi:hypothetical protein
VNNNHLITVTLAPLSQKHAVLATAAKRRSEKA